MRPVTDQFLASLRSSHLIAASCDLLFPGETTPVPVPVETGSVTIDRTAQIRRTGSLTIPWSLRAGEDLGLDLRTLALGGYAIVRRGLRYADGSTEHAALGTLRVESVNWDTLTASASLELADRMTQVRDESFTAPYQPCGQTPATAAVEIVHDVFGDTIGYDTPYHPTDALGDAIYTGSRADALNAIATGYGAQAYFDATGDFVFSVQPQDDDPVLWTVDAGQAGVMVGATESLDRSNVYNGVLVKGQSTADTEPLSALATYDDPASPVQWGGPFGKVALVVDSNSVTTVEQAGETARTLLRLQAKQTRQLELTAAPNPALEAGDTIRVVFPDGRTETHLVDVVTVSLSTDVQRIATRTQSAVQTPARDRLFLGRQAWRELQPA
jgi:hypothetical protein